MFRATVCGGLLLLGLLVLLVFGKLISAHKASTWNHLYKFHFNYILVFLCAARATLTIYQQYDIALTQRVPVIEIKLNDVVVVGIWGLLTVFCGLSIAGLYGVLGLKSFRDLFFDIFYGREKQCIGLLGWSMVILAILLTGASASYIPRLVYFIYIEWTSGFIPLVQTLQMYPAFLMVVQTLYQSTFLLQAYATPSSFSAIAKANMNGCKVQLEANTMLNLTLLLHCICITAVIEICVIEKDIVLQLAVGEMVYRLWAVLAFLHLRWKIEQFSDETDDRSEDMENSSTESTDSVCKEKVDSARGPVNSPSETSSTKDSKGHETIASIDTITPKKFIAQATEDEDSKLNYSKLLIQSLCKESARDQGLDLVTPQQCTDEEPSQDKCTFVVPKPPTSLKFNFS